MFIDYGLWVKNVNDYRNWAVTQGDSVLGFGGQFFSWYRFGPAHELTTEARHPVPFVWRVLGEHGTRG
jgi:hypothetical protein